jgi:hypothetical protein
MRKKKRKALLQRVAVRLELVLPTFSASKVTISRLTGKKNVARGFAASKPTVCATYARTERFGFTREVSL